MDLDETERTMQIIMEISYSSAKNKERRIRAVKSVKI